MKLYLPHIQKIHKREVICEKDGNNEILGYYVYFITTYTWIGLFGKMHQKTIRKKDKFLFNNEKVAKLYANDAVKPSRYNSEHFPSAVFPRNWKNLKENGIYIEAHYEPSVKFENRVCLDYVAKQYFNGLESAFATYLSYSMLSLKLNTLDEFATYVENAQKRNSTKIYSSTITDFGAEETKELEEKRNDLVDNEIKRSEEYINFLKTLKK